MHTKELINYIEDKTISIDEHWYYHATNQELNAIEKILKEGIKSSYLRKEKSSGGYNGKYYISLGKVADKENKIYQNFKHLPKFILNNINPINTSQKQYLSLCETILPFRYSHYYGEYHVFLKINQSKIIALEYSLSYMLDINSEFGKQDIKYLQELIQCLKKLNIDIPIYDFSSNCEINKQKVLSLKL